MSWQQNTQSLSELTEEGASRSHRAPCPAELQVACADEAQEDRKSHTGPQEALGDQDLRPEQAEDHTTESTEVH